MREIQQNTGVQDRAGFIDFTSNCRDMTTMTCHRNRIVSRAEIVTLYERNEGRITARTIRSRSDNAFLLIFCHLLAFTTSHRDSTVPGTYQQYHTSCLRPSSAAVPRVSIPGSGVDAGPLLSAVAWIAWKSRRSARVV
ncbi:hypothetical protein WN55_06087 [Dufourea novaeangliae]|uniref:Uncharacterized protein n=1 Tax=Dufourea novaeangliae TaxID=178035 RepID=A0A154P251_DUFNO|nr:hypothetical protein WN55_06087 [Dufourea novaeangliae]